MSMHYYRDCASYEDLEAWTKHYSELGYATYSKGLRLYYFVAD